MAAKTTDPSFFRWIALGCPDLKAARVPGGIVLRNETEDKVFGGRESMVFVPMDDKTKATWLEVNAK